MRNAVLLCLALLLCPVLFAQEMMTNDSVLKLLKAGLSEDLVVTTINSSPGKYDTSATALIALKKAGASDRTIAAIILNASGATQAAPAPTATAAGTADVPAQFFLAPGTLPKGVDSVGIYYLDKTGSQWQEVPVEIVNFKKEGALKHYASAGVLKGEMTGLVGGNRSPLSLKLPSQFILYVPEGRAPGEYQLVHLHANADSREFRAANGGIVHDAGGALRDVLDYTPKKIAPRVYLVEMSEDFERGEYGFLPPSDAAVWRQHPHRDEALQLHPHSLGTRWRSLLGLSPSENPEQRDQCNSSMRTPVILVRRTGRRNVTTDLSPACMSLRQRTGQRDAAAGNLRPHSVRMSQWCGNSDRGCAKSPH